MQQVHDTDGVENAINRACGEDHIKQIAMATRKQGYGSGIDYWLVLCGPGPQDYEGNHVVRVQVER